METKTAIQVSEVWEWMKEIADPEIPVLSIIDMGIVRNITIVDHESVKISITPTYSGCPAMDTIGIQIRMMLLSKGFSKPEVILVLHPAWTTDWLSEAGKVKLKNYGIAPPQRNAQHALGYFEKDEVPCPRCASTETELISLFGATSCKSMHKCNSCLEPFEHFKCH